MRLATTCCQEIVLTIPARNETVQTGSNEHRQLHGRLIGSDLKISELLDLQNLHKAFWGVLGVRIQICPVRHSGGSHDKGIRSLEK
jgi:hypothetical protein